MNKPNCNDCRLEMQNLGQIGLRTGGMEGGMELLFGAWADMGEKVVYFDLYRCRQCGRLEFFDHNLSLPNK